MIFCTSYYRSKSTHGGKCESVPIIMRRQKKDTATIMSFGRCHWISVEPTMLGPCWFNALLVKRDTWIKRVQKMAKVDLCFSSNKLTKWYLLHFLSWSWPIFCTEKNWMTLVQNIIPDICHRHHRRCLCKNFLPGVIFSRLNAKNCHFTVY